MRLIGDLYDLLICGAEGRYGNREPRCPGMRRLHTWHAGTVLEVLTILPDIDFALKPPATSGFSARAVDAMLENVVSHLSRISTRLRARSHAIFVDIEAWSTAHGNGEGRPGPLRVGLFKLLFVTETACQLNVTSPVGTPYARFSNSRRSVNGQLCAC